MAAAEELPDEQKYYVFNCVECPVTFGDSLATARMNTNLKSISLKAVTDSVKVTQKYETSAKGEDKGSAYRVLECKSCHHPIGCMYDTTPRKLDSIRDLYTLHWDKVRIYQLGKCTNKIIKPEVQDTELMIQSLMISLNERVTKLESLVTPLVKEMGSLTERFANLESLVEEIGSEDEFIEDELDTKQNEKKRKIR